MSSYARDECAGGPLLSIRVALVPAFHLGDDVVLLAMDGAGLEAFGAALDQARRQGNWQFERDGRTHHFHVQPGAVAVGLEGDDVHWRLDVTKASEIGDKLAAMRSSAAPSHHYVDIDTPTGTLVLSLDEYVGADRFGNPAHPF
ncbi:MAG: hypothetical protein E6R02_00860 [Gammaproteobacteria bacterium]|nr:MAG: hypothetical protein E6R02_00860 [Gammaproteobacteria bacterium]